MVFTCFQTGQFSGAHCEKKSVTVILRNLGGFVVGSYIYLLPNGIGQQDARRGVVVFLFATMAKLNGTLIAIQLEMGHSQSFWQTLTLREGSTLKASGVSSVL